MTSNNYRTGASLERDVLHALSQWYPCVMRSAGSHGIVDVVAISHEEVLLVQAKRNGRLDPGDWNDLWDLSQDIRAVPLLAERPPRKAIRYWRLTGPKILEGRNTRPPKVPWAPHF